MGGGVAILIQESFSYRALPTPKFPGIECVGLGWDSAEKLAIWLIYCPPNAPADGLPGLLEVAAWRLQYPRVIILGDFNIHADETATSR